MHTNPAISVVLGSFNRKPFLKLAIDSIRKELFKFEPGYEIIVVDGGSTDGSIQWLGKQKDILFILQYNHGKWHGKPIIRKNSGYYNNLMYRSAKGKYVCIMTDDAMVVPGAIRNSYYHFEERMNLGEKLGALAFYNNDWPVKKNYVGNKSFKNVPIAHYGLFLREAMQDVEYLDEDYYFYSVDDDFSCKLWRQGWKVEHYPSFIFHCAHANLRKRLTNNEKTLEDWNRFCFKWGGVIFDPNEEVKRNSKEVKINEDKGMGRKFARPYYFSLAKELLVAIMCLDIEFFSSVKRGFKRYLKTGQWFTQ